MCNVLAHALDNERTNYNQSRITLVRASRGARGRQRDLTGTQ